MATAVPFGFHRLTDRFSQLANTESNAPLVNAAVLQALRAHEERTTRPLGVFSFQTTQATQAYRNPIESSELQPLDEHGRALVEMSVKPTDYTVGLPLYMAGTAIGETWLERRQQTVGAVAEALGNALRADDNWRARQMFSAMFQAADYTHFDKLGGAGSIVVKPFANGDDIKYAVNTSDAVATDTHLLAQSAPISDAANKLVDLANEIREHPDNTGDILVFCSDAQATVIRGLEGFYAVADPNIAPAITAARLAGTTPATPVGTVIGYEAESRTWIVVWQRLNTIGSGNYLIAVSTGGERPVAERINPAVPGFGLADTRDDYPYYERQYVRMSGFGVWNRTAAAILQIGSGTYSVPTGYGRVN